MTMVNFPKPPYAVSLPNEVELSFEVSEANYEIIGPSDFVVHIDYKDVISANRGYIPLKLVYSSPLVKNIVLKPSKVIVGN